MPSIADLLPLMPLFGGGIKLDNLNELFVFVHIPKTGGTSMQRYMRATLGRRYTNVHRPLIKSGLENHFKTAPPMIAIGGHFGIGANPALPFFAGRELRYFSLVREPVSRFISHYRYGTRSPKSDLIQEHPEIAHVSLDEFIEFSAERSNSIANIQTRMLTGRPVFDEEAHRVLISNYIAICPSEHSIILCKSLAALAALARRPAAQMAQANESTGPQVHSINRKALEFIYSISSEDMKLHHFVTRWFAESLLARQGAKRELSPIES
jgi:hypothetical protein